MEQFRENETSSKQVNSQNCRDKTQETTNGITAEM